MGVGAGPYNTRTGLVLWYDFANTKSFRGEPTTNLVLSPKSVTTGYATTIPTRTDNQITNFDGTLTGGLLSGTGWIAYTSATTNNNIKYTTSWYVKAGTNTSIFLEWGGAHQGNRTSFTFDARNGTISSLTLASGENYGSDSLGNGWWRVWYSSTLTTGNAYYPEISTVSGTLYLGGLQIEQKAYPTAFVIGTRGTTVATGGGAIDLSGSGNNAELVNGPTASTSFGGLVSFDGTNDHVRFPMTATSTISVSCWVRSSSWSTQTHPMIVAKGINVEWILWKSDDGSADEKFGWRAGGASTIYSSTTAQNNLWYHLLASVGADGMKLWVNGVLEASNATTSVPTGSIDPCLGSGLVGGNPSNLFSGDIAAVQIWNKQLTATEVTQVYQTIKTRFVTRTSIVTSGLILHLDAGNFSSYKGTGTTWTDLSGYGYTGTLTNGPVFRGGNGGSIVFDGTNDSVLTNLTGTVTNLTIECWYKGTKTSRNHLWNFGLYTGVNDTNLSCDFNDGYDLWVYWESGGTNRVRYNIDGSFTDSTIKCLVFTHTGSTNKVFLNGSELTITESGGTQTFTNVNGTGAFDLAGVVAFGGDIYNTKIYNRALSASEVLQNYNAQKSRFGL